MRPRTALIRFIALTGVLFAISGPAFAASAADDAVPNPARQPSFHRTQSSAFVLGSIEIPAIGLDEMIRSGVDPSVIDQGVAQWVGVRWDRAKTATSCLPATAQRIPGRC